MLKSQHKHNMQLVHNTNLFPIISLKYAHRHDTGCPQSLVRYTLVEASWSPLLSSKLIYWLINFYTLCWAKWCTHFPHAGLAGSERHSRFFFFFFNSDICSTYIAIYLKQIPSPGLLCVVIYSALFTTDVVTPYILPWAS